MGIIDLNTERIHEIFFFNCKAYEQDSFHI
jgi:hypothetical protein